MNQAGALAKAFGYPSTYGHYARKVQILQRASPINCRTSTLPLSLIPNKLIQRMMSNPVNSPVDAWRCVAISFTEPWVDSQTA